MSEMEPEYIMTLGFFTIVVADERLFCTSTAHVCLALRNLEEPGVTKTGTFDPARGHSSLRRTSKIFSLSLRT